MILGLVLLPNLLTIPQDRPDILIADFEQKDYGQWKVTGTAFGSGPAHGTLPGQMPVDGFEGNGLVNSFVGNDGSTGSLTSPKFHIHRHYINFLIGGGYHPNQTCIDLIRADQVVRSSTGRSKTPQDKERLAWATWDVSQFGGKDLQIQILDLNSGGWGHINIDQITQSDQPKAPIEGTSFTPRKMYQPPFPELLYREKYRPQFHFSAKKNWLNDPNGLVYFDGEYHLFFQHNPGGIQWGDMHWGHAVSPDLVHWQELPIALSPDEHGTNFSGSAAVDIANTTGFGQDGKPPLVAMYTAAGKPFTQCLAYSNDHGRTWTKYKGNPVLDHIVGENRDPRIFWHAPTHKWVMALYLDGDEFAIFSSPNLKEWKELSRLHLPGSSECPDLFEIPIEGTKETRWIFFGANYRYLIGNFDGTTFTPEEGPFMGDHGTNFYASQTYNNTPDGRRIQIGWMNGTGPMPDMPFNQQMSFPCVLTLHKTPEGLRLAKNPVKEIETLRKRHQSARDQVIDSVEVMKLGTHNAETDLHAVIRPDAHSQTVFTIGTNEIIIDPDRKIISAFGKEASLVFHDGEIDIRILVDRSSVEIFAQNGFVCMTSYLPTPYDDKSITISSRHGKTMLKSADTYELKWAWK